MEHPKVETSIALLDEKVQRVYEEQQRTNTMLHSALHGTGDTPGIVVRTDRLEQWKSRHGKVVGMLFGALATLVVARAWELMTGASS